MDNDKIITQNVLNVLISVKPLTVFFFASDCKNIYA